MSNLKQLLRELEDIIIDTQFIQNTVGEGVRERRELREKMKDLLKRAYDAGMRQGSRITKRG